MRSFKNTISPTSKLRISLTLWHELTQHLEAASAGRRESGAFLLGGTGQDGLRTVQSFVPYEALDPEALTRYAVYMPRAAFSRLFGICEERRQEVVADVHAHPLGAGQSLSDRANPMMPVRGHIALIVPNYAKCPVRLDEMTFNVYESPGHWRTVRGRHLHQSLEIAP